jgi:hypothetical protein
MILVFFVFSTSSLNAQRKEKWYERQSDSFRVSYERGQTTDEALFEAFVLMQKAGQGDANAQNELGYRFLMGKGFGADTSKAAYWINRAAEQHHQLALYNLAIFYYNGVGVPWNPYLAFDHFREAANLGMPSAMYVVGLFYTDNLALPRDFATAYRWEQKSADLGFAPAKEVLKQFESLGITANGLTRRPLDSTSQVVPTEITQAPLLVDVMEDGKEAKESSLLRQMLQEDRMNKINAFGTVQLEKDSVSLDSTLIASIAHAAEAGSPEALTVMGTCYERGIVVPQNRFTAAICYLRALRYEFGNALKMIYGLAKDQTFMRAVESRAKAGDPDAEYIMVGMFVAGAGVQMTEAQAFQMLEQASAKNHVQSLIEVGLCYFWGRWTPMDRSKAEEVWRRASRLGSREADIRLAAVEILNAPAPEERARALTILLATEKEGSITALMALAYCYETGQTVEKSASKAIALYRKAFQRRSQGAYRSLKKMHDDIRPPADEFKIKEDDLLTR